MTMQDMQYGLSSLDTYSTWEGDTYDQISRAEKWIDNGGMSG